MFEKLEKDQCSVTLFGIVKDEATVQQCLAQAETVIGDLNTAPNAMFAAWPLSLVKGFSQTGWARRRSSAMIWLQFALSALVMVIVAIKLAEYGDAIAYHTQVSGMFIGALLIASADLPARSPDND